MNDRAISVLENYDMEVTRTFKGRGTIVCETGNGFRVLKEYKGNTEKLELLDLLQGNMSDVVKTDRIVRNKAGELFCKDTDGVVYIVKEQIDGRECNYKSEEEILHAFHIMAKLHCGMCHTGKMTQEFPVPYYVEEMEKHTKECRHARNYLRKLKIKSDFERALLREYEYFMQKAEDISKQAKEENRAEYERFVRDNGLFCHGDFQYHNLIFTKKDTCVINLERFAHDSGVRDFYLLFRKISEKTDWSVDLGEKMLDAYQANRSFAPIELKQLYYRLAYPDKFWKIVNFYYNSKKSWIPDKNMEKLENLVKQEKAKERLLKTLFYGV